MHPARGRLHAGCTLATMIAVLFLAFASTSAGAAAFSASCPSRGLPRPVIGSGAGGAASDYSALMTTGGPNAVPQFLLTGLHSELEFGGR